VSIGAYRQISPTAAAGSGPGWTRSIARLQRMVDASPAALAGAEGVLVMAVRAALAAESAGSIDAQQVRRRLSRAVQEYVAGVFLGDLPAASGAPAGRCAIDLDGVLEVDPLGFPFLTPAGAIAVRGLIAHGYELVLATGRALSHVQDRCESYVLAGGVAEYGSVIYDHRRRAARSLVPEPERVALERIRRRLGTASGVVVDRGYAHVVRAYEPPAGGPRRALGHDAIAAALAAARPAAIRVVSASTQTDFVAAGVNKGAALTALAAELDGKDAASTAGSSPFAFAIGDSAEDLPMLRLAAHPFAPANAEPALAAAGIPVMRSGFQAGFADAVAEFLGHAPGSCPGCRLPAQARTTRRVLAVLGIPDRPPAPGRAPTQGPAQRAARVPGGVSRGG
jgi:hydroxymethylpyrimidine pyrophosphatase-like HAD family hydrolase